MLDLQDRTLDFFRFNLYRNDIILNENLFRTHAVKNIISILHEIKPLELNEYIYTNTLNTNNNIFSIIFFVCLINYFADRGVFIIYFYDYCFNYS